MDSELQLNVEALTAGILEPADAAAYAVANARLEGVILPDGFEWVLEAVASGVIDIEDAVREVADSYAPVHSD